MNDLIYKSVVRIRCMGTSLNWLQPYKKNDSEGIGTGFFINSEGYILTCSHVSENASKIWITIPESGNEEYECDLISVHPEADLSLIKIKKLNEYIKHLKNKTCSYLELGDSDNLQTGQDVLAIGYPLGQNKLKITKGIISGRDGDSIQTDTAINPGNSGGPLVISTTISSTSQKIKVIGVNKSIIKDAENVGYATPISQFINLRDSFFTDKILYYPSLALQFEKSGKSLLDYYECSDNCKEGVYIKDIYSKTKNRNRDKNTIEKGDILCKVDNYDIDFKGEAKVSWYYEPMPIDIIINRYKPNQTIKIEFWSNSRHKYITETYKLQTSEVLYPIRYMIPAFEIIEYEVFAGCIFMNLRMNHYEYLNKLNGSDMNCIDNNSKECVIITHVFTSSYAGKLGVLKPGNIIEKINDKKVNNIEKLRKALKEPIVSTNKKKKFIKIQTKNNNMIVYDLKDCVEEQLFLSNIDGYEISNTTKYYLKMFSSVVKMNKIGGTSNNKKINKTNKKTKKNK